MSSFFMKRKWALDNSYLIWRSAQRLKIYSQRQNFKLETEPGFLPTTVLFEGPMATGPDSYVARLQNHRIIATEMPTARWKPFFAYFLMAHWGQSDDPGQSESLDIWGQISTRLQTHSCSYGAKMRWDMNRITEFAAGSWIVRRSPL